MFSEGIRLLCTTPPVQEPLCSPPVHQDVVLLWVGLAVSDLSCVVVFYCVCVFQYLFVCLFVCLFRESSSRGGAETERDRENPKQAPHCQHRA